MFLDKNRLVTWKMMKKHNERQKVAELIEQQHAHVRKWNNARWMRELIEQQHAHVRKWNNARWMSDD
jgi:hypothetical protein